jgi:hypothetical protein
MHVASVCSNCFRRFIRMLQVFYLVVAYVLQWLQMCFPGVSYVRCKCFNCFKRTLQVFHLRYCKSRSLCLHMLQWDLSVAATCWARLHVCGCGGGTTVRVRDTKRAWATMRGRNTVRTQDTERCGPRLKQLQQARASGCADARRSGKRGSPECTPQPPMG